MVTMWYIISGGDTYGKRAPGLRRVPPFLPALQPHRQQPYWPLDQGHCGYPRLREKKADTPACPHYSPGKTPEKPET